jgi:hypothetical protein
MTPILGIMASGISGSKIATGAFESIATATGTGSSSTITFSSIPSTYKHLQIRGIGRTTRAATDSALVVRLNGDTASNYTYHTLLGNGTAASAGGFVTQTNMFLGRAAGNTAAANLAGVSLIDIVDYASTTKNKTLRSFHGIDANGVFTGDVYLSSGLWLSTSAITSISLIVSDGSSWTTASTFALYGIN